MANEEDLAALALQQTQQQQQAPMPREEEDMLDRHRATADTLHASGRTAREQEEEARLAERIRKILAMEPDPARQYRSSANQFNRFVDMRIPLWGVMVAGGSLVSVLFTMWFTLGSLKDSMGDMQRMMRENANTFNAGDRAMVGIKAEVDQLEETLRDQRLRLDNMQNQINQNAVRLQREQPR